MADSQTTTTSTLSVLVVLGVLTIVIAVTLWFLLCKPRTWKRRAVRIIEKKCRRRKTEQQTDDTENDSNKQKKKNKKKHNKNKQKHQQERREHDVDVADTEMGMLHSPSLQAQQKSVKFAEKVEQHAYFYKTDPPAVLYEAQ